MRKAPIPKIMLVQAYDGLKNRKTQRALWKAVRRLRLPCSRAECAKHVKERRLSRYPGLRKFYHTIKRQTQTELFKVARRHGYTQFECRDCVIWMTDMRKAAQKRRRAKAFSVAGDLH